MKKMNNDKKLVSVIIPVYNVEDYIEKCISSVINQTYNNMEIILVDDGSKDNSGNICEKYSKSDKRIKVIHKKNGGISDARNIGIKNASGIYITFIDSDDFVDNSYVELLYDTIEYYDADISIASHRVLYKKKCLNKSNGEKFCAESKEILEKILYDDGIDISAWGKMYKKELFEKIKFPSNMLYEDAATTYKLVDLSEKIAVNSQPVYNYVIRNNSISNCEFNEKKLDLIKATKEMTDFVKSKYPELEKACNRRLIYAYLSTLTQLAKANNKNKKIEKELMDYIKENKKVVLKDKRIPKRDRLGIYAASLGMNVYKFFWKCYSKITGRT